MANPVQNQSFEDPGILAGEAENWTEDTTAWAAEGIAPFGLLLTAQPYPMEDFEDHWYDNQNSHWSFDLMDLLRAMFEGLTDPIESFEYSWALNHISEWVYDSLNFARAVFNVGTPYGLDYAESFEESWGTMPYNQDSIWTYAGGTYSLAQFQTHGGGSAPFDDFEEEWSDNDMSTWVWLPGQDAMFDAGANAYEDFEGVWTHGTLFP